MDEVAAIAAVSKQTVYQHFTDKKQLFAAEQLRALARPGLLRVDDPLLAAEHFNWLILSIPLNKAMFRGSDSQFASEELERLADEGVRVFLAAYGTP